MVRLPFLLATVLCTANALNVAICGATGRTGRLVVQSLIDAGHSVTALVRDEVKAKEVLPASVECKVIDIATANGGAMRAACAGAEKFIWCATGFTEDGESIDMLGMKLLPFMDSVWRSKTSTSME